jgi:hypothetical protein
MPGIMRAMIMRPGFVGLSLNPPGVFFLQKSIKFLLNQDLQPIKRAFIACEFRPDNNDPLTTIEKRQFLL